MHEAVNSEGVRQLTSDQDASVNFIRTVGDGQALESRFVWRGGHYFTCYLSSQTACTQACRMCWLTQTGQNKGRDATVDEIREQARRVLGHYAQAVTESFELATVTDVLFSFMARGEALTSDVILNHSPWLFRGLSQEARTWHGLRPHFCVSTIMPEAVSHRTLADIFPETQPDIYYSVYSMRPEFRRRWLPNAMDPRHALDMLAAWQEHSRKIVTLHWAPIAGECDSDEDVALICEAVAAHGLRCDFNLVRYNPWSDRFGAESPRLDKIAAQIRHALPGTHVKVVSRVGPDVAASCGMFVKAESLGGVQL